MPDLTPDTIRAMDAGPEMDRLVAAVIGDAGEPFIMVSNDGGDSMYAWVDRSEGPWYTEEMLRHWLNDKQGSGYLQDCRIVTKTRFKPYSTDIAAAWEVVERMRAARMAVGGGFGLTFNADGSCSVFGAVSAYAADDVSAPTAPLAICRAALLASLEQ